MTDETRTPRAAAVAELAAAEQGDNHGADHSNCGPEPERPSYLSPQAVRDRYYDWKMCKMRA